MIVLIPAVTIANTWPPSFLPCAKKDTEETVIADLKLYEGEPLPLNPVIIELKGQSPEQYGEGW